MPRKTPARLSLNQTRAQPAPRTLLVPAAVETRLAGAREVPIDQITPDPEQPRRSADPEALEELARSIRDHGILQPLLVRLDPASGDLPHYIIIAGGRRYEAARKVKLERLPVVVREEADPSVLRALQLVENIQREALDVVQEAPALRELMELRGLSLRQVAEIVGRPHNYVQRRLELLFDERIVAAVRDGRVSASTAAEMKALPSSARDDVIARVEAGDALDVAEIRRLKRRARSHQGPSQEVADAEVAPPSVLNQYTPQLTGASETAAKTPDDGSQSVLIQYTAPLEREHGAIGHPPAAPRGLGTKRMIAEHELEVVSLLRTGDGQAPEDEVVAASERDLERLRAAGGSPGTLKP